MNAAKLALAGGDLTGAVAALDKLTGTGPRRLDRGCAWRASGSRSTPRSQRVESLLTSELGRRGTAERRRAFALIRALLALLVIAAAVAVAVFFADYPGALRSCGRAGKSRPQSGSWLSR